MARNYRKVDDAAERLRRALGMLQSRHSQCGLNPIRIMGALDVLLEAALLELVGEENTEDSPDYIIGKATVEEWCQPELPFGGV